MYLNNLTRIMQEIIYTKFNEHFNWFPAIDHIQLEACWAAASNCLKILFKSRLVIPILDRKIEVKSLRKVRHLTLIDNTWHTQPHFDVRALNGLNDVHFEVERWDEFYRHPLVLCFTHPLHIQLFFLVSRRCHYLSCENEYLVTFSHQVACYLFHLA